MGSLEFAPDFELGAIRVRPRKRVLETSQLSVTVEPLVMRLLLALVQRAGRVLTREEIFEICWGPQPVGDDSLNRIVAVLRKALQRVDGSSVTIETVPSIGYVLRFAGGQETECSAATLSVQRALQAARDSWRLGLPKPDHLCLELLRWACRAEPQNGDAWAALALSCRNAAEYAEPLDASAFVSECEQAARQALSLSPGQPEARTALASIAPLFGRWAEARNRLEAVLADFPGHHVASHDLAIVEMATGRVSAAKAIMDELVAADPLAACFCYKSTYQNWSIGNLTQMDHVADRAIQLWPTHPAVWTARFWTLAYTGRASAALDMLGDGAVMPELPRPLLLAMRQLLEAILSGSEEQRSHALRASVELAAKGPAQAIASMFSLGLLKADRELFEVSDAYYIHAGTAAVPVRRAPDEPSINEQDRRVTQILFTPVFDGLRTDNRFSSLCHRTGLTDCWERTGLGPDHR